MHNFYCGDCEGATCFGYVRQPYLQPDDGCFTSSKHVAAFTIATIKRVHWRVVLNLLCINLRKPIINKKIMLRQWLLIFFWRNTVYVNINNSHVYAKGTCVLTRWSVLTRTTFMQMAHAFQSFSYRWQLFLSQSTPSAMLFRVTILIPLQTCSWKEPIRDLFSEWRNWSCGPLLGKVCGGSS